MAGRRARRQPLHVDVAARDVEDRRQRAFLEQQGTAGVGDDLAADAHPHPPAERADLDGVGLVMAGSIGLFARLRRIGVGSRAAGPSCWPARAEDPLFTNVETISPRNHVHHFRLDSRGTRRRCAPSPAKPMRSAGRSICAAAPRQPGDPRHDLLHRPRRAIFLVLLGQVRSPSRRPRRFALLGIICSGSRTRRCGPGSSRSSFPELLKEARACASAASLTSS